MELIGPIIGLSVLTYVGYCSAVGGTHVRGKGWVSKEEHPKSYMVNQILYVIFGLIPTLGYLINALLR